MEGLEKGNRGCSGPEMKSKFGPKEEAGDLK